MNERRRPEIPGKLVLFILTIVAMVLLFASFTTNFNGGFVRVVAEVLFAPMERGLGSVSERMFLSAEQSATIEELREQNKELSQEVEKLNSELSAVTLKEAELEELRSLMALKNTYREYETTGAYVIGKSTNNWFNTFVIDKGSEDGIKVDMNVLAGEGLVGIVTNVGRHHAMVRSIIDDSSNVSGMVSDTGDNLIVSGSLETMTRDGLIGFSNLEDLEGRVKVGETIVTSNISDKYVPGILIGYIRSIKDDPNGLTKFGEVIPVADFKHLNEVLVVLRLKDTGDYYE